ncbi:STOREKEEPER protein-like [Cucurbita pepo subsp. pepo]|uniref:STOREKEEPER protein-like n=1 Tax=Cucurbita pepo subsp. pepo TaxID=3664 RepID=UPI000C9D5A32|nr:STOREKEEPER protein-like [Cucurbita pepo subsp. pepo]
MQEEEVECPNEEDGEEEMKETKNESGTKFPKLWSEEDEISLVSGYYEYQGIKAKSDIGGFYEFIKPRLIRSCVKQSQVSDKICRLKKKFMENSSKFEHNTHNTPHLQTLFELSTKIWGSMVCSKFEVSNDLMCEEFDGFLFHEGVDVELLESERVRSMKRKFGEVQLCRSRFEYKQAKLAKNMERLKYDHYNRALVKFFP